MYPTRVFLFFSARILALSLVCFFPDISVSMAQTFGPNAMYYPYVIAIAAAAAIIIVIFLYISHSTKSLRRFKNELDKDWSDLEFLFKQRQDELPRLIQTSRSYMPGEKRILDSVSAARTVYQRATTGEQKAAANAVISQTLTDLFAAARKHADLQNNNTFVQLQTRIEEIDERISERCDLYNESVDRFNARVTRFPGRLAGLQLRALCRTDSRQQETAARDTT
jgi:LemA protein